MSAVNSLTGQSDVTRLMAERDRYAAAIRKHRDARGDDRCHMDDGELYAALPEGDTRPQRETLVTIENCQRYIECRQQGREYVSPQRLIEELEAEVRRLRDLVFQQSDVITKAEGVVITFLTALREVQDASAGSPAHDIATRALTGKAVPGDPARGEARSLAESPVGYDVPAVAGGPYPGGGEWLQERSSLRAEVRRLKSALEKVQGSSVGGLAHGIATRALRGEDGPPEPTVAELKKALDELTARVATLEVMSLPIGPGRLGG